MLDDNNSLKQLISEEVLRPILLEIGLVVHISDPAEVLKAALTIFATAGSEKNEHGARLFLDYPNGMSREMVFCQAFGPKLVAKDGVLVKR